MRNRKLPFSLIHFLGVIVFVPALLLLAFGKRSDATPSRAPTDFVGAAGNIHIGSRLYFVESQQHAGTVKSISDAHQFDDGSVRSALQIELPQGGSPIWVPRDTAKEVYLVKRSEMTR